MDHDGRAPLPLHQQKAIEALCLGASTSEAAAQCGRSERTVRRWLGEDVAFRAALADAQQIALGAVIRRVRAAGEDAVSTLREVMSSRESGAAPRVSASRAILEALKWAELEDLAERVRALEGGNV